MRRPFRLLFSFHWRVVAFLEWMLKLAYIEPLFRARCDVVGQGLRIERMPFVTGKGRITLGSNVYISGLLNVGFHHRFPEEPELCIGDGTFIGHGAGFNMARGIRIGNHCLIASFVTIMDNDGHPIEAERRRRGEKIDEHQAACVIIGDDVWIGTGAIILKGVSIGDRAIVGARAVVTKSVPSDAVVAGNPARLVKQLQPLNEEEK